MKRNLKKLQKEYAAGEVTVEEAKQTISSYLGILKHCDSYSLKRTIFGEYGSSEEYEGMVFPSTSNHRNTIIMMPGSAEYALPFVCQNLRKGVQEWGRMNWWNC